MYVQTPQGHYVVYQAGPRWRIMRIAGPPRPLPDEGPDVSTFTLADLLPEEFSTEVEALTFLRDRSL